MKRMNTHYPIELKLGPPAPAFALPFPFDPSSHAARQYTQVTGSPLLLWSISIGTVHYSLRCSMQETYSGRSPHLETFSMKSIAATIRRLIKDKSGSIKIGFCHLLIAAVVCQPRAMIFRARYDTYTAQSSPTAALFGFFRSAGAGSAATTSACSPLPVAVR